MLHDNALLEIFDSYRKLVCHLDGMWKWQKLAHVCRRWRHIVLASPRRLDLRIACNPRTPTRRLLDIWPPFPISISGLTWLRTDSRCKDNVIAALERRDRVFEIDLSYIPSAELGQIASTMEEPFPALTRLRVHPDSRKLDLTTREVTRVAALPLPNAFLGGSAPRLREFTIRNIAFPALPNLVLSATHFQKLQLFDVPHAGYISPQAMATFLLALPNLKSLTIEFPSPESRPLQMTPPPLTHAILPSLTYFQFDGASEYLVDFITQIDTPLLDRLYITFSSDLVFDIPRLYKFLDRTDGRKPFVQAELRLRPWQVMVFLESSSTFEMNIACKVSDWPPLESMTRFHTLWKATAWRHGRRANKIPPLLKLDGSLATSHTDLCQVLSDWFFLTVPKPVPDSDPSDPLPHPAREFAWISDKEVSRNLSHMSNKSAPGPSGITYKLLKWCHSAAPSRLTSLFNATISLGHHPWCSATVVPIPKPGKIDYQVAKAYRPISLLECCGKLLERIVSKQVLLDAARFHLFPPRQFGSWDYHTAADAVLSMVHMAQTSVKSGHVATLLLFDIQGFFDNLHVSCLVHIFRLLGFAPSLCDWVWLFLTDRRITLSFNGEPLPKVVLNHGTPQGSPLSPILLAIYILPLLQITEDWCFKSLSTYIDDGAIVATGATHSSVIQKCADGFFTVADWLLHNGLCLDPDKMEFIAFQPHRANPECVGALRLLIDLQIPGSGTLQVHRSSLVRYLGIFINNKFNWEPHVKIMAARVQSSFWGLLLGNSVCGIDFHNWRLVFHAITLPVLLYGLPVWSHHAPKSLLCILQVAQNIAVCKISGTFRTTPVEPLHNMLTIPPIKYTIVKYHKAFTICLSKLPPSALLRTLPSNNPSTIYIPPTPIPTPLTSLTPTSFPVFCILTGLTWSHPWVFSTLVLPATPARTTTIIELANQPPANYNTIHIYPIPHPDHFVTAFLTFMNGICIEQGFRASHNRTLAAAEAAIAGVLSLGPHPGCHMIIFVPNWNLHRPLLSLAKHKYLPQATLFTGALGMQCFLHPDITISIHPLAVKLNRKPTCADPHIFPCNWPGPCSKDFNLAELQAEAQMHHIPDALPKPLLKSLPFRL